MLKYVSKFILDILPSVVATIIGAYIVNHYIVTRPDAPAAAVAATPNPKAEAKVDVKTDIKAPEAPADAAAAPEIAPAKGKAAVEKAVVEKASAERSVEKSVDTASAPTEIRRRSVAAREKSVAKALSMPAPAPTVAASAIAPPAENASTAEERRDANDLARAAIERLRISGKSASRSARASEPPRPASPSTVQALPPAIMVSTPRTEPFNSATGSLKSSDAAVGSEDASRPPAEIPVSGPLDLRAEAAPPMRERTTVADDMLAAAKSVFHNMLPH